MTDTTSLQNPATIFKVKEREPERGAYSIAGWCRFRNYSVPGFYKMEAKGVAPKVIRLPAAAPRITVEADKAWLEFCNNLPVDIQAQVEVRRQERRTRTRKAGAVSLPARHPKHKKASA